MIVQIAFMIYWNIQIEKKINELKAKNLPLNPFLLWFFSYSIQCIWQHVYEIVNQLSSHRDAPRLCHKFHLILLLVWLKYALYSRFIACKCNANKLLHAPDPQSSYNILQLSLPRWHVGHWLVLHENYEVNVHSTAYIPSVAFRYHGRCSNENSVEWCLYSLHYFLVPKQNPLDCYRIFIAC